MKENCGSPPTPSSALLMHFVDKLSASDGDKFLCRDTSVLSPSLQPALTLKDYGKSFDKTRGIHTAGPGSGYGRGSAGGSRE